MGGRQVVARFFIEGFGNAEQRAAWLPRLASVAISEPRVGAHPKLLTTRAEEDADGYSISGEKAWVTNGPLAAVFIVLAVTSIEETASATARSWCRATRRACRSTKRRNTVRCRRRAIAA